jgi:hypothetical protein
MARMTTPAMLAASFRTCYSRAPPSEFIGVSIMRETNKPGRTSARFHRIFVTASVWLGILLSAAFAPNATAEMRSGDPELRSMGTLEFGPNGTLFIGDSVAGQIVAIQIAAEVPQAPSEGLHVTDLESKFAALIGTAAENILIHDLAVHPISLDVYVSVSRGRGKWDSRWSVPNDLADANVLLRIHPDGSFSEFEVSAVMFDSVMLPNPVDAEAAHMWKKDTKLRVDTITDLVLDQGTLYVAGLSNEEFSATMWQVPFPFGDDAEFATLEIFHGAHGEFETHAPIRTFLPYDQNGETQIFASYLCTPLVTFSAKDLSDGQHIRGRTVAEFGSGNYPLDMVWCELDDTQRIVMANSMLPLMTIDPADILDPDYDITAKVEGYAAGVPFVARSGSGIQQLDNYDDNNLVALQRMPSGRLDLNTLDLAWLTQ